MGTRRTILAATDFSAGSYRALERAAILARELRAHLLLLHVANLELPAEMVPNEVEQAAIRLESEAIHLTDLAGSSPETLVRVGCAVREIVSAAKERDASLIVLGRHRRRLIRDMFKDLTVARTLREGCVPVLLVNKQAVASYAQVLVATDLSSSSGRAIRYADALNLFSGAEVSITHASKLISNDSKAASVEVGNAGKDALAAVVSFLDREGLNITPHNVVLDFGDPLPTIFRAIDEQNAELLIVGTRKQGGLSRFVVGSVASDILRRAQCDVLAVPPEARIHGLALQSMNKNIESAAHDRARE